MQAPIRVITLGNDDDAVNTDDNAHHQATEPRPHLLPSGQNGHQRQDLQVH